MSDSEEKSKRCEKGKGEEKIRIKIKVRGEPDSIKEKNRGV